jgi:Phage integrase family
MNDTVMIALEAHAAWYIRRFGECKPEWYVFPAGKGQPNDPTTAVTTLKAAWKKVRDKAKVVGRWHDNRHTLVTELAESGAGDEVIMSIAGHVSRAMLSRYSHLRMEAKRRALDEIAARQRTADETRKEDAERRQHCSTRPRWLLNQQWFSNRQQQPQMTPICRLPEPDLSGKDRQVSAAAGRLTGKILSCWV